MANTRAKWINDKLRFDRAPMFTSAACATTNVRNITSDVDTETLIVACPMPIKSFSTTRDMCFRAKIGGVCATSSQHMIASLRWGSTAILTAITSTAAATGGGKHQAYDVPYTFDFTGRIGNASSSGHIAATCISVIGNTSRRQNIWSTTGSTDGAGVKMSTSDLNLESGTTLGLNITLKMSSTQTGAAGTTAMWTNTIGYIELFSG